MAGEGLCDERVGDAACVVGELRRAGSQEAPRVGISIFVAVPWRGALVPPERADPDFELEGATCGSRDAYPSLRRLLVDAPTAPLRLALPLLLVCSSRRTRFAGGGVVVGDA